MKKIALLAGIVILIAVAGLSYYLKREQPPVYRTAKVERGTIVSTVSATGNLAAVVTVQVGTQVSGTILKLYADYNSPVKKGQVIAQIDPSLFNAQVEQSSGGYAAAEGSLRKARADLVDAKRTLERNRQLVKEGIISQSDYDLAETKFHEAEATVRGAEGTLQQTRGTYVQAQTNRRYATIRSPVDGTVISRNVDVGQTVAASFQTPTLFTIAQDLTKMKIETSVDEADISRVKEGQKASFTVDAYPESRFNGKVIEIRNAPVTTQNVVTYVVVVGVDNRELKLKPGMTANVSIETAKKDDVLKIPAAALRFKQKGDKERKEGKEKPAGSAGGVGGGRRIGKPPGQQVYVLSAEKKLVAVPVKTGVSSDGVVELVEGNLKENDEVVVEQLLQQKKKSGMTGGGPMGPRF